MTCYRRTGGEELIGPLSGPCECTEGRLSSAASRPIPGRRGCICWGGREIEGPGIRLRRVYRNGEAHVARREAPPTAGPVVTGGATEFSIPRIVTSAVIDLEAVR